MKSAAGIEISAFRRTYLVGLTTRIALFVASIVGSILLVTPGAAAGQRVWMIGALMVGASIGLYVYFSWRSIQVSREALEAPEFMARGDLESAEKLLKASIRRFSIFPRHRLVELYHLAVLRQGQRRFAEAAELAGVVQTARQGATVFRGGRSMSLAATAGLVRIESLLDLADLRGAYAALHEIGRLTLNLQDSVRLLASRVRYEAAVGAWEYALHGLSEKLRLIDMMPPGPYAMATASLALAARKMGRDDLGRWLLARAMAVWAQGKSTDPAQSDLIVMHPELADWAREETALNDPSTTTGSDKPAASL